MEKMKQVFTPVATYCHQIHLCPDEDWEAESFSADDKKVRQALKRVGPLANEVRDIGKTLRNSLKD